MNNVNRPKHLATVTLLISSIVAQAQSGQWGKDGQIEGKVQQALSASTYKGSSILSSVKNGVVKLTGNVRSEQEKEHASEDLAGIDGVKTVLNNLVVVDRTVKAPAVPAGMTGPKTVTIPQGTLLSVRLTNEIDTKTAKAGDTFHAITATGINAAGYLAIPDGSLVTGRVIESKAAGRLSGAAELSIELVSIEVPGASAPPTNAPVNLPLMTQPASSKINGRGTNTAAKAGGGAAFGAIVGALAGGGTGAGIGAASGGALGLGANALTRGKDIDLKPEQLVQFRTSAPLDVSIRLEGGRQVMMGIGHGMGVGSGS